MVETRSITENRQEIISTSIDSRGYTHLNSKGKIFYLHNRKMISKNSKYLYTYYWFSLSQT